MGSKIDSIAITESTSKILRKGSLSLSSKAARLCLKESGIEATDLDIIINTGIYRDKNIAEPAISALLQGKIQNPSLQNIHSDKIADNNTFSFDLSNGGCGLINAIQIIDNLINLEQVSLGMVITGDSEPIRGLSENYHYKHSSGAILLSGSNDETGFSHFMNYSFPDYIDLFHGYTSWEKNPKKPRYNNILFIKEKETYLEKCVECASQSLNNFISSNNLSIDDIDLIITSQSPNGFQNRIHDLFGTSVYLDNSISNRSVRHSSGPLFNLHSNWKEICSSQKKRVLFLTVGAGISVSIVLYNNSSGKNE